MAQWLNRSTQLLNAIGIEGGIHNRQVLKYQPSVTSRLIFQYLIIINGIKWWNITLDVTDGWYFRIWPSSTSTSLNVAFSNWVRPMSLLFSELTKLRMKMNWSSSRTWMKCFISLFKTGLLPKGKDISVQKVRSWQRWKTFQSCSEWFFLIDLSPLFHMIQKFQTYNV